MLTWPLLILAAGLLLLLAEAFIPSGGLIGFLALGCLAVSLYQAFMISTSTGMKFLLAESVLIPVAAAIAVHLWPRTPIAKKMFLTPPDPEEVDIAHDRKRLDHLVGEFGRALTPLRPSGLVDFDGRRLDGLAEEGLIPPGSLVKAVRIQSGQLIVRAADDRSLESVEI